MTTCVKPEDPPGKDADTMVAGLRPMTDDFLLVLEEFDRFKSAPKRGKHIPNILVGQHFEVLGSPGGNTKLSLYGGDRRRHLGRDMEIGALGNLVRDFGYLVGALS